LNALKEDDKVILRLRPLGQKSLPASEYQPEYIEVYIKDEYEKERTLLNPIVCKMQIQRMNGKHFL
jgi:hypothetical protein